MRGEIISEGCVRLGCDYTLCGHLPALPDWLSGDCVDVVHDAAAANFLDFFCELQDQSCAIKRGFDVSEMPTSAQEQDDF